MSMVFVTDIIPGVFMLFLFAEMAVMALPLKAVLGSEYTEENELSEQLVLKVSNASEVDWQRVDPRISDVVQVLPSLFTVMVPTFKPFTEVILKLAKIDDLQILQVSFG